MVAAAPARIDFTLLPEDLDSYMRIDIAAQRNQQGQASLLSYMYGPVAVGVAVMIGAGAASLSSRQFAAVLLIALSCYVAGVLTYSSEVHRVYRQRIRHWHSDQKNRGLRSIVVGAERLEYTSHHAQ